MNLMIMDRLHFAGSCTFWADYTKIKITGTDKYLSVWEVSSNLPEQKATNLFNTKIKLQMKMIDSLSLIRMADPVNRELQISILHRIDSISKLIQLAKFDVLKSNINSLTSLNELYQVAELSSKDTSVPLNIAVTEQVRSILNRD